MASLSSKATSELLKEFAGILTELRKRRLIHSSNNPVADYAEHLVCKALSLTPAPPSNKGYDATDDRGCRYEIKGRRVTAGNPSRQLSAIRDIDGQHFDFLAVVLFASDFSVTQAFVVPASQVKAAARYREHVNAWILHGSDRLCAQKGVRNITPLVKRAADAD